MAADKGVVHVLGDHRIRIFASESMLQCVSLNPDRRIRKHEELFIDYG
jgi:hypothetical protein